MYVGRGHEDTTFIGITLVYRRLKDTPRFLEAARLCSKKIERSPVVRTCEILGVQHMISMEKISWLPRNNS